MIPEQLSVAVTVGIAGYWLLQSTVVLEGIPHKRGASESWTVIVWDSVAIFPQSSVTVQVRIIVPVQEPKFSSIE